MSLIDKVDRELISVLQEDGRLSLTQLGRRLRMSHVGVSRRLRRLIEEGVVKVQANLSHEALRMKLVAVLLEVEGRKQLDEVCRRFSECPRMVLFSTLIGGLNLLALMVAEDESVLESITTTCAIRESPGIKRTEIYLMGEVLTPKFLPLKLAKRRKRQAPCGRICSACSRFETMRCLGCPAVEGYRGPL